MTNFEHMYNRLLGPIPKHNIHDLRNSEWSHIFELAMRRRLVMGALRYGCIHAEGKKRYDRIGSALKRLRKYEATGNLEFLVDVANLMLLEFEEGRQRGRQLLAHDGGHDFHVKAI